MTLQDPTATRAGVARVPRSRGAVSGMLLVLLGIWGAGIPFVGPYWNFAYAPNAAWHWSAARGWYEVAPGAAALLAGLILLVTSTRAVAVFAGWLASLAGAWFVIGPIVAPEVGLGALGTPLGGAGRQVAERVAFFYGIGVVILFTGALALGRLSVRTVRDLRAALAAEEAERRAAAEQAQRRDASAMVAQPGPQRFEQMPAEQTAAFPTAAGQPADRRYDEQAGRGYDEQAGRGYDEQAGRGYDERAGRGYDERAGRGYDERAGRGYDERAGSGYDQSTQRRYDEQTGREFDEHAAGPLGGGETPRPGTERPGGGPDRDSAQATREIPR